MKFSDYITEASDRTAKIILAQIKALDKWALMSWGAKDYVSTSNGIQFDVRGSKFRGRVIIELDRGRDLYNITFGNVMRDFTWQVRRTLKHIQAETLVTSLDDFIG